jgi:hypothetical protein
VRRLYPVLAVMACSAVSLSLVPKRIFARQVSANDASCGTITQSMGYRVGSLSIGGRWLNKELRDKLYALLPLGSEFNSSNLDAAIELVVDELNSDPIDLHKSRFSVAYVDAQVCKIPSTTGDKLASIAINPYYVQVDLSSVGRNILPIPRVDTPAFSAGVPPLLSSLSPLVSGFSDSNYGPSLQLETSTNLLDEFGNQEDKKNSGNSPLNLDLAYRRSLDKPNYSLNAEVSFLDLNPLHKSKPQFTLGYSNSLEPLGRSSYWSEDGLLDIGLYVKQAKSLIRTYTVGINGKFSSDYIENAPELESYNSTSEQSVQAYAIGDMRLLRGVGRIGIWGDLAYPSNSDKYQRLAAQAGYATEVGKGHNTLGIKLMSSAGYAWGNPPQYGRFFGGTQATDFLYDSFFNSSTRSFPAGPLLRSYGETQAGLKQANGLVLGATSYWGASLSSYIPIPGWSRPLIPDIKVSTNKNMGEMIKGQVKNSRRYIVIGLEQAGYSRDDAEAESTRMLEQDIIPAVNNLVDHVNLFSIRPFVAVDFAQLGAQLSPQGYARSTYLGAGGGIQANLIGASMELGYMQSIAPSRSNPQGNFFLRFVLKDLF